MAATYRFILQKEKQTSYFRIEMAVVLLHLITFIVFAVSRYPKGIGMSVFGIGIALFYAVLYFLNRQRPFRSTLLDLPIYFFALWWFAAGIYWMGILVFIFSIFATLSKQKMQIIFSDENILYHAFLKRSFNWADISNVVLKDDMLTIDFKNNKIIQQPIEESSFTEADFNRFCQKLILAIDAQSLTP